MRGAVIVLIAALACCAGEEKAASQGFWCLGEQAGFKLCYRAEDECRRATIGENRSPCWKSTIAYCVRGTPGVGPDFCFSDILECQETIAPPATCEMTP